MLKSQLGQNLPTSVNDMVILLFRMSFIFTKLRSCENWLECTSRLQALLCRLLCQYLFCSLSFAIGNVLHILHVCRLLCQYLLCSLSFSIGKVLPALRVYKHSCIVSWSNILCEYFLIMFHLVLV